LEQATSAAHSLVVSPHWDIRFLSRIREDLRRWLIWRRKLERLQDHLRRTQVVTPDIISDAIAAASIHSVLSRRAPRFERINRLIEAEAWTEMALAVVELQFPQWKLRRLVYEDGAWHCWLSRQWNAPEWLDDWPDDDHRCSVLFVIPLIVCSRVGVV